MCLMWSRNRLTRWPAGCLRGPVADYDDGRVVLDSAGVTLRRYYFPTFTAKHIPYERIRGVRSMPSTWLSGKGRIWGTAHPGYWFPLDPGRLHRDTLVVLDLGGRISPAFTPDDPERVLALLQERTPGRPPA